MEVEIEHGTERAIESPCTPYTCPFLTAAQKSPPFPSPSAMEMAVRMVLFFTTSPAAALAVLASMDPADPAMAAASSPLVT